MEYMGTCSPPMRKVGVFIFVSNGLEILAHSPVTNMPKLWFPVAKKHQWESTNLLRELNKYQ